MAATGAMSAVGGRILTQIVQKSRVLSPALSRLKDIPPEELTKQFEELHGLINRVTVDELEYPIPRKMDWYQGGSLKMPQSPCFYSEIYDDEDMSIGVFSLREKGCEIPLHDHPDITGILKVIFGCIKITSYSWVKPDFEKNIKPPPSGFKSELSRIEKRSMRPAVYEGTAYVTPGETPCIVGPRLGNVHKVEAVDGTAAFFDVLLPRYEPPERDCSYFRVLEPAKTEGTDCSFY